MSNPAETLSPAVTSHVSASAVESSAADLARRATVTCRVRATPGSLLHSGVNLRAFYLVHALGAAVPLAAGAALFGYRALAAVAIVVAAAAGAWLVWRRIGHRGRQLSLAQSLWMALLVALMLPPHLASNVPTPSATHLFTAAPWPLLASAGVLVVIIQWLVGGIGGGRFHPAAYTALLILAAFSAIAVPHWSLSRQHLLKGDLLHAAAPLVAPSASDAWLRRPPDPGRDAYWTVPASQWLSLYTRGEIPVERGRMAMHELLRDRMPPLEDLVVGGHPAPIGTASLIGVIVGGFFLMYRGVIDFRVPLLIVLAMYAALLVLPVPTVVTDAAAYHRWLILREPDVGWAAAVTFANYQITAGPAVFMAFFLATAPSLRPMVRRARSIYAILIGLLAATAQLYLSVALGPYIALVVVGLIAPHLDRWFQPRTTV